jgi:hypothetical protein
MQVEIAYVSLSGNTEKLAHELADKFPPEDTFVTDLSHEMITGTADTYLFGFGVNKGAVPLSIMDALDELHEKKIMFFVTCGMEPTEEYKETVEKRLLPFIPDDCIYCGLFMCRGKFPENVIRAVQNKLEEEPDNSYARRVLADAEGSSEHPSASDCEQAYSFISERLSSVSRTTDSTSNTN